MFNRPIGHNLMSMKTEIFKDIDQINAELKAPRAEAAKIQNLLDVIGEVQAPEGTPQAKTGLELVNDLFAGNVGTDYLRSILVIKQGEEELLKAIAEAGANRDKTGLGLNSFFLNGEGRVESVQESIVIEEQTFYTETPEEEEYITLVQAYAQSFNALETFLKSHQQPSITSNDTRVWGINRLDFVFRDGDRDYSTASVNLRVINDFKTI